MTKANEQEGLSVVGGDHSQTGDILMSNIVEPSAPLRAEISQAAIAELAASFESVGQMQAIGVKPIGEDKFEIVFGHRRFLAAKLLGWVAIKANIVAFASAKAERLGQLVENLSRENLTPLEEALALNDVVDTRKFSVREIARFIGKSREWVQTRLNLTKYAEPLRYAVHIGDISLGVAAELSRIDSEETLQTYIAAAARDHIGAETAKIWVDTLLGAVAANQAADDDGGGENGSGEVSAGASMMAQCFCCGGQFEQKRLSYFALCSNDMEMIAQAREQSRAAAASQP